MINIPVKATYDFFKTITSVDYEAAQRQAEIDTGLLQDFMAVAQRADARLLRKEPSDAYELLLLSVYRSVFDDKEKHQFLLKIIEDIDARANFGEALRNLTVVEKNILIVRAIDHVRRLKIGLPPFSPDAA